MKHLKKSFILLMLLTATIGSRAFGQDYFKLNPMFSLNTMQKSAWAKRVLQDNDYSNTGCKKGNFYGNLLMLDGQPLDYGVFSLRSKGELTLLKEGAITGQTMQIPFYVYLRRLGNNVLIPGKERPDIHQIKVDISEILQYAAPWDQLVIEPVRKEDAPAKRILNLLGGGC